MLAIDCKIATAGNSVLVFRYRYRNKSVFTSPAIRSNAVNLSCIFSSVKMQMCSRFKCPIWFLIYEKMPVAVKPGGEHSKVNKRASQEKKWRNICRNDY